VKKFRFLTCCGVILSVCVLLAVADDANEPVKEIKIEQVEAVNNVEIKTAEPNYIETEIDKAWADADRALDGEAKNWLNLEMDERVEFARASEKTTKSQFELLRLIAASEGATQTIEAMDKLLEARTAKVDEVLDEAREARRQEHLKDLEERRKAFEERRKRRQQNREQK
jgi:hypothetical protein